MEKKMFSLAVALAMMVLCTDVVIGAILFEDDFDNKTGVPDTNKWQILKTVPAGYTQNQVQITVDVNDKLNIHFDNDPNVYKTYRSQGVQTVNRYGLSWNGIYNRILASGGRRMLIFDMCLYNGAAGPMPDFWLTTADGTAEGRARSSYTTSMVGFELGTYWSDERVVSLKKADEGTGYRTYYHLSGPIGGPNSPGYDANDTYHNFKHCIITVDANNIKFYIEDSNYAPDMTPVKTLVTADYFDAADLSKGLYAYIGMEQYGAYADYDCKFEGIVISDDSPADSKVTTSFYHDDFDVYPGSPADWQDYCTVAYSNSAADGNLVMSFVNSQGTIVAAGRKALPTPSDYSGRNFLYYTYDIKEIAGSWTGLDMVVSGTQLTSAGWPSPEFRVTLYQQPNSPGYKYNNRVYTRNASGTWTTPVPYDGLLYDRISPYGDIGEMTLAINDTNFVLYLNGTQLAAGTHGLASDINGWTESYMNLFAYTYGTGNNHAHINSVDASGSVPVLLQQEKATCYEPTKLASKEYVIRHLCTRADILQINIPYGHYDDVNIVRDVQDWIDTAHDYGMKIAFSHQSVPNQGQIAPAIGPNDLYYSPDSNTIRPESGSLGPVGYPDHGIDFGNVSDVNAFCLSLKTFLSKLDNLDYYFFNETSLPHPIWPFPYDPYDGEPPYFVWGTYSDAALEDFRLDVDVNDPNAKFPVEPNDSVFVTEHPEKFVVVGKSGEANETTWNKWWNWRFRITRRYMDAVAKAVHEQMDSQQNTFFKGVIYFASNPYTYDTKYNLAQTKWKSFGVAIDDVNLSYVPSVNGLASSEYIDILISEDAAYQMCSSPLGPSDSVKYFKTAAEKYGKDWGNFLELWLYDANTDPNINTYPSAATLDTVLGITTQYNCRMIAAYHDGVFLPEDLPDYNNFDENYSSTISDWWGQHIVSIQANSPSPANGATCVSIDADLSWTAGVGATSHDVYFGTIPLNDANHSSNEFKGNQAGAIYDPNTLDANTTYYWRIDEVGNGTTTGDVWSFTTAAPTTIFADGFESNFDKWTDGGTTDWDRTTSYKYSGSYSAHAGNSDNDLISDNINTAGYYSMTITCWYMDDGIDDDDNIYLQLYDGTNYDDKFELGNTSPDDAWYKYEVTLYNTGSDAQYFNSNFRLKFEGTSIDSGENLWIDDVSVVAQY